MLKSPQIKTFWFTEDRYSKRLKNSSQNASEHEPGGQYKQAITKSDEPMVIAIVGIFSTLQQQHACLT